MEISVTLGRGRFWSKNARGHFWPKTAPGPKCPKPWFLCFLYYFRHFLYCFIFCLFFIFYSDFLLVQIWELGGGGALWGQNRPFHPSGNQQASIFQFRWWPAGLPVSGLLLEPKAKQTQGDQQASIFEFGWWPVALLVPGLPLKRKQKGLREQQASIV